eukprot:scaffold229230_cov36-Tisochrysis_lutea.AAC.2
MHDRYNSDWQALYNKLVKCLARDCDKLSERIGHRSWACAQRTGLHSRVANAHVTIESWCGAKDLRSR